MKKEIHPKYQQVLFIDSSTGFKFVCGSALTTSTKETFEGKEYPSYHVSISSASHPFFTGGKQLLDAEGRVDKFNKRYAAKKPDAKKDDGQQQQQQQEQPKEDKKPPKKKK
jgi:large subunit ribosomal protein L31